jgi:predicted TPR repeat methyltransferase
MAQEKSLEALLKIALAAHQQQDLANAKIIYEKILQENPQLVEVHHWLALLLIAQKDWAAALSHLHQTIALEANNADLYSSLGHVLKLQNKPTEAIQAYEKAIALCSTANAHNNLATIFYQQNDLTNALKHYAQAVQIEPGYIDAHFNLGLLFLRQQNKVAATIQFQNVVNLQPDHLSATKYLADLQLQQDKLSEAEQHYRTILALQPENLDVLNNLGVTLLKLNNLEEASSYFSKVIMLDEKHSSARNNLAALYLQENRYDNAARHYQVLLELTPNDVEAHYNFAVALMALGKLAEAMTHFDFVLQKNPHHRDSLCNVAAIYLKQQQIEKAIHCYRQVAQIDPQYPLAQFMLQALTQSHTPRTAPKDYIQNLFDNYAGYYDKHVADVLHYQVPQLLYQAVSTVLTDEEKKKGQLAILDLGCGTGLSGEIFQDLAHALVGVDLSPKMLAQAHLRHCYDELICADIITYVAQSSSSFDLIIAADVLVYLGDLKELFSYCFEHLHLKGLLAFTVELLSDGKDEKHDYFLQKTARFSHSKDYLHHLANEIGFSIAWEQPITPRYQDGKPIAGYLMVLRKIGPK